MREQRGKNFRLLGALLVLLALCVIPNVIVKAETLEDQVVQTVKFGEFDQMTLKYEDPIVIKVVLKEKGTFSLDFSPKKTCICGRLYNEQGIDIGSWRNGWRDSISGTNYEAGTYYISLWGTLSPTKTETITYFANFTPTANSSIEICIPLKKGKSVQLGTIFTNSKDKKVTWSSSKKSVAAVSSTGKVTAKKKGTTIIKVFNSSGLVSKIKVKVTG